ADFVLMAVKMYDFEAAIPAARAALAPDGRAATIQNGLDAPYDLAQVVGADRVIIGTAAIEATVLEPGVIGHLVPQHQVTLAELKGGPTPRLTQLVEDWRAAEIHLSTRPDGYAALWTKAAM